MRVLSFDPAGEKSGVAGVSCEEGNLKLYLQHLIESPSEWDISRKNVYMAHCSAAIAMLDKPDIVVFEKPYGMGYSAQSLKELIGAIKSELICSVKWQGISEARKTVLGEGYGGEDKLKTAEWLLQYPWDISSKRSIKSMIDASNIKDKSGFDVLDAVVHAVCYLVSNGHTAAVAKPPKVKRSKKKEV